MSSRNPRQRIRTIGAVCHRTARAAGALVAAMALVVVPHASHAAVFSVDDADGLIAAIDAANLDPTADTIQLANDILLVAVHNTETGPSGTPKITTPIAVEGNGFRISRPSAAPEFRLFYVSGASSDAGSLTLEDVVLQGGDVSGVVPANCSTDLDACGGAVLNDSGELEARNGTRFDENDAFGGGAVLNRGNATIREAVFFDNSAVELGGAIHTAGGVLGDPATVIAQDSRFENNESGFAGGAIHNAAELWVSDSVFEANQVTGSRGSDGEGGGAVSNTSFSGVAHLSRVLLTLNQAERGGALSNYNASDLFLDDCDVTLNENTNFGNGGGIWNSNSGHLVVRGSRVTQNRSGTFGDGGGIVSGFFTGGGARLTLEGSVVSHNIAESDGGGIYMGAGSGVGSIVASQVDFNEASGDGGGIYKRGFAALDIVASSVSDNLNHGFDGGGIAIDGSFSSTPPDGVTISDSTIARNRLVTGDGGGIYNDNQGIVTIRNSAILDNEVTGSAPVGEGGGGVYSNSTFAMATIVNSTIRGNVVQGQGGGVKNSNASQMFLENVTITENVAGSQGGGMMVLTTSTFIGNSLVVGNTANHPTQVQQHNCGGFAQFYVDQGGNFTNDANGLCPAGFTVSQSINLGPLADNGGPTQTQALGAGSVAIDAVPGCAEPMDQRGVPRDALCDSGAYEGDVTRPVLRFVSSSSSAAEEPGGVHVVDVLLDNRAGDISNATAEVYVTITGTASEGEDFDRLTAAPLVFTGTSWPSPGTGASLPISLDILRDAKFEGAETIQLEIRASNVVGPVDLGSVPVHVVTITDAVSDLEVDKTIELTDDLGAGGVVDPGDELTFTVTVTNHGPASAFDVTVEDVLDPALLDLATAAVTATEGSYDPLIGEWSSDGDGNGAGFDLASGQTETLTIVANVLADTGGADIVNTARLSLVFPPTAADPDPSNDTATASINIFGCRPKPASVCTTGFPRGKILINEKQLGREKLIATWTKGLPATQTDFGNPLAPGGTAYFFCLYDDQSDLVAALGVERAGDSCGNRPCWKSQGGLPPDGKGYVYKDPDRASDGVDSIKLQAGADGKTKLTLKAQNLSLKGQAALPVGLAAALTTSFDGVVIQMLSSNAGCYSIELDEVQRRDTNLFKAKE